MKGWVVWCWFDKTSHCVRRRRRWVTSSPALPTTAPLGGVDFSVSPSCLQTNFSLMRVTGTWCLANAVPQVSLGTQLSEFWVASACPCLALPRARGENSWKSVGTLWDIYSTQIILRLWGQQRSHIRLHTRKIKCKSVMMMLRCKAKDTITQEKRLDSSPNWWQGYTYPTRLLSRQRHRTELLFEQYNWPIQNESTDITRSVPKGLTISCGSHSLSPLLRNRNEGNAFTTLRVKHTTTMVSLQQYSLYPNGQSNLAFYT